MGKTLGSETVKSLVKTKLEDYLEGLELRKARDLNDIKTEFSVK